MKKTWYSREGSKGAELWTVLHLPYTFMAISFVIIGFGLRKPVDFPLLGLICVAYFLGLGIAAHCFDQLPGMGSTYVKHLSPRELLVLGIAALAAAVGIGVWFTLANHTWGFLLLVSLQAFFAIAYPVAKLFKGVFHTDFWFSVGFGFMPVVVGFYANTLTFSLTAIPFGVVCFLIALIEITLSRYVRALRKSGSDEAYIMKPELGLKLLCLVSYALALAVLI